VIKRAIIKSAEGPSYEFSSVTKSFPYLVEGIVTLNGKK
jgi:hypothetical protein